MAEVEKILNDRPLTLPPPPPRQVIRAILSLSLQVNYSSCGQTSFLSGESDAVDIYGSKRWKQAQYLADIFWKRWILWYLPTLQVKQKWLRPRPNLAVGDLVLVVGKNSPRGHWPKGIVQEVFRDRHGTVRQVTVKTATLVLRRDIRKLCLLEGVSGLKA